jgi:hypothetical protein
MVVRIDLAKAYDHIDWRSLKTTLDEFGFPPYIITLIMNCVSSNNSLSIIWICQCNTLT